jgi:hypothetical protein
MLTNMDGKYGSFIYSNVDVKYTIKTLQNNSNTATGRNSRLYSSRGAASLCTSRPRSMELKGIACVLIKHDKCHDIRTTAARTQELSVTK